MGKFQINMFFYMHAALLCLESQKMQDLQHKNIRIFKYERKKNAYRDSFNNLGFLLNYSAHA